MFNRKFFVASAILLSSAFSGQAFAQESGCNVLRFDNGGTQRAERTSIQFLGCNPMDAPAVTSPEPEPTPDDFEAEYSYNFFTGEQDLYWVWDDKNPCVFRVTQVVTEYDGDRCYGTLSESSATGTMEARWGSFGADYDTNDIFDFTFYFAAEQESGIWVNIGNVNFYRDRIELNSRVDGGDVTISLNSGQLRPKNYSIGDGLPTLANLNKVRFLNDAGNYRLWIDDVLISEGVIEGLYDLSGEYGQFIGMNNTSYNHPNAKSWMGTLSMEIKRRAE